MKALDRLKASTSMKPTPRTVTLPNGDVFEFLSRPVTLAQRARAQKQAGNDSASDFALQLLVMLAEDENGQKLFDAGDIAELRNALPASVVESLMLQLISEPEGEEDEALDMKSTRRSAAKGQSTAG
jgi:hypothetical protein